MKCIPAIPDGCGTRSPNPCALPQQQAKSLSGLVKSFRSTRAGHIDGVINFTSKAANLEAAVSRAALSENHKGKLHEHQYRLGRLLLRHFARDLQRRLAEFKSASSFEEVHDVVRYAAKERIGVGALTVYDIAQRIASYKRLSPRLVYLHAGTAVGARMLGVRGAVAKVADFPKVLRKLRPVELEDFLCTQRGGLLRILGAEGKGRALLRR